MRTVAFGQILINYFHTFNADERPPTEFPLCQEDDHTIKRLHDFMFQLSNSDINGAGKSVHILHAHRSFLCSLLRCYC